MALALPLLVHVFEPVQAMVQWLSGGAPARSAVVRGNERPSAQRLAVPAPERGTSAACPALMQRTWGGPTRSTPLQRPLRVVRVIDHRSGDRTAAGRMVISGRMADVCAELDRLADLDTRH